MVSRADLPFWLSGFDPPSVHHQNSSLLRRFFLNWYYSLLTKNCLFVILRCSNSGNPATGELWCFVKGIKNAGAHWNLFLFRAHHPSRRVPGLCSVHPLGVVHRSGLQPATTARCHGDRSGPRGRLPHQAGLQL